MRTSKKLSPLLIAALLGWLGCQPMAASSDNFLDDAGSDHDAWRMLPDACGDIDDWGDDDAATCLESCGDLECGSWDDGCGGTIDCGVCDNGDECNPYGYCGCEAETCDSLQVQCGSHSDGCGGQVDCGGCASGSCSDGQCVCQAATCASLGKQCGLHDDGCGGQVDCGSCSGGTCQQGQCVATAVDCSGIAANSSFELCQENSTTCAGVYTHNEGCASFCGAAGLVPVACYGGEPGCQKETGSLDCYANLGHQSDWCECGTGDNNNNNNNGECGRPAGGTIEKSYRQADFSPRSSWVLDCRDYAYTAKYQEHEACDSQYSQGSGRGTATFFFYVARGNYKVYLVGRHTINRNPSGAIAIVKNQGWQISETIYQNTAGDIQADLIDELCLEGQVEVVVDSTRNGGSDSVKSIRLVPSG